MVAAESYVRQVENELKEWCIQAEEMLAQTTRAGKANLEKLLKKQISLQGAAQQKLQALKQATEEERPVLRAELDALRQKIRHDLSVAQQLIAPIETHSIGWAEGVAKEDEVESIGWAEGVADSDEIESIGWAEGIANEDFVKSKGWVEGYKKPSN